jgi:hypothetical protein
MSNGVFGAKTMVTGAEEASRKAYDTGARLVLVGDWNDAGDAFAAGLKAGGGWIGDRVELAGASRRLADQVSADAVLVRLGSADAVPDDLWSTLCAAAEASRYASLVAAPKALRPALAARAPVHGITLLFDPTGFDWLTALGDCLAPAGQRLHDKGPETPRLQQISEEVGRIASALAALSEEDQAAADAAKGKIRIDAGLVRAMIRARRLRDQFFRSEIFADPAWDMLLDLFAARLEKRRVAVSSLCIAAAVPSTTALRWIKSLCDQGLFVRLADAEDGRRVFIELLDTTAAAMEAYLRAAQRISPLVA